ncbi:uncharacterized protein MONBRDRAFT_35973 [Monosiga brevicollis MX1]|uniref:Uncharacterized protein n=1 Tax=Monosiga brevicollis TaxID=81824 RepID=A9UR45_MONBE|nr:uncharacterized protein MONBRDRAFT_35973 [Monosiga brevicollis MX1]EDQ91853.1 predicted protein [Monosiga brevicollis MX1]|eukprot:XP_001743139.1 hypothetical protein [Monosiga brevicollis MX1]
MADYEASSPVHHNHNSINNNNSRTPLLACHEALRVGRAHSRGRQAPQTSPHVRSLFHQRLTPPSVHVSNTSCYTTHAVRAGCRACSGLCAGLCNDHRKLIIASTTLLTALIIGMTMFFLYPRTVGMRVTGGTANNLTVVCLDNHTIDYFNMTIEWDLIAENQNYLAVSLSQGYLSMKTAHDESMGNMTVSFDAMPHRKKNSVKLVVNATIGGADAVKVFEPSCVSATSRPYNRFAVQFMLNVTAKLLDFHESITVDTIILVGCPITQAPLGPASTLPLNTTTVAPTTSTNTDTNVTSTPSTTPHWWRREAHLTTPEPMAAEQDEAVTYAVVLAQTLPQVGHSSADMWFFDTDQAPCLEL